MATGSCLYTVCMHLFFVFRLAWRKNSTPRMEPAAPEHFSRIKGIGPNHILVYFSIFSREQHIRVGTVPKQLFSRANSFRRHRTMASTSELINYLALFHRRIRTLPKRETVLQWHIPKATVKLEHSWANGFTNE